MIFAIVGLTAGFIAVVALSCCVAAGRADRQLEQYRRDLSRD